MEKQIKTQMNWTSLPQTPQTDAALRAAAAEKVMGWTLKVSSAPRHNFDAEISDKWMTAGGGLVMAWRSWNPQFERNNLSEVFTRARFTFKKRPPPRFWELWDTALVDPRAALAGLLDLLAISVPHELE